MTSLIRKPGAAPITLSPQQFRKTEAFKHGGDYRTYLHFLAVHRGRLGTGPPVVDPLAPNPNIAQDAAAAVRAQTAPVIANIQADYARQQKAGASAIAAGGKSLMDAFAQYAPAEKQAYDQATGQMTSLNTALANRLQGVGSGLQGELAQKLAAINAPGAQQQAVAVGTGAIGAGAANAGFASGAANISDLIARGAAARDYGAKLPGIAARIGATNLRDLAAQTESGRAKAVGAIRAQIPGMMATTLGQLRTEELNKAIFRANTDKAQQAETAQTQRTQLQIDAANARAAAANATRVGVANQTSADKAAARAAAADKAAAGKKGASQKAILATRNKAANDAVKYAASLHKIPYMPGVGPDPNYHLPTYTIALQQTIDRLRAQLPNAPAQWLEGVAQRAVTAAGFTPDYFDPAVKNPPKIGRPH